MRRSATGLIRRATTDMQARGCAGGASAAGMIRGVNTSAVVAAATPLASHATDTRTIAQMHAECAAARASATSSSPPSSPSLGSLSSRSLSSVVAPTLKGRSAVLVGLFEHPRTGRVHVLLTQRSSDMRSHAGDVALPGGKRDEEDASDVACALREAQEEVGLPRVQDDTETRSTGTGARVMCTMESAISKNNLLVVPIVAQVPVPSFLVEDVSTSAAVAAPVDSFTPVLNGSEVAVLFSVPLSRFLEAGPGYAFRDIDWMRTRVRMHEFVLTLPRDEWRESKEEIARIASQPPASSTAAPPTDRTFCVWGLTAYVLVAAAARLFNRKPDFATVAARQKKTGEAAAADQTDSKL